MRYVICLMISASLLLSPLTCRAQSNGLEKKQSQSNQSQAKNTPCNRIVITLKTGQKIEGCFEGQRCDDNCKNCRMEITQKGIARTIASDEVAEVAYKKSFWRKVGETALIVLYAPLFIIFCRKDCEL